LPSASWRAAEEEGFAIVSCFDDISPAPAGLAAWNAPSLLTAMAGVTETIALAVDVLNISIRHPFLLAGQLAVAQAASGGRVASAPPSQPAQAKKVRIVSLRTTRA